MKQRALEMGLKNNLFCIINVIIYSTSNVFNILLLSEFLNAINQWDNYSGDFTTINWAYLTYSKCVSSGCVFLF